MAVLAYKVKLHQMIVAARNNENRMVLTDKTEEDYGDDGPLTFKALKELLEDTLKDLEEERNHIHDYKTENGFCSGCGMDGNA